MISRIFEDNEPEKTLQYLLSVILKEGPEQPYFLEKLAYYKLIHPEKFSEYEQEIISSMGLFYKIREPNDLLSIVLNTFSLQYQNDFGSQLTPVQASIRYALEDFDVVSISAPTSAGKSFAIRSYLQDCESNSMIIVPSRALVDEYLKVFNKIFHGFKNVQITPFVDDVFRERDFRRIFVVTPERAKEIFYLRKQIDVGCFFFDEAHLSEDKFRGVIFGLLVEKIKSKYKTSKIIFAHPFVQNPEAQVKKFFLEDGRGTYSKAYNQGSVGRICVYKHINGNYYYFSPYEEKGHQVKNAVNIPFDFKDFLFSSGKTILVYVSKSSIYKGDYKKGFEEYISSGRVREETALDIIKEVELVIGSDTDNYYSDLVQLMLHGVVIHHGSVPLEARFLIEKFISQGFARICFATTTLAQGVNMPFDAVWLNTMNIMGTDDGDRALAFKNLIGRSGRSTEAEKFDYGYVFTNNPKLFSTRLSHPYKISEESIFEKDIKDFDEEQKEDVISIMDGTFDEEIFSSEKRVLRLTSSDILPYYYEFLDFLYANGRTAKQNFKLDLNDAVNALHKFLLRVYQCYINRNLLAGESAVFEQATKILSLILSGISFKEISKRRYYYVANINGHKVGDVRFLQAAAHIPNLNLKSVFPIFPKNTSAENASYDAIVFDTYDYVDHVISFSINDKIINAFRAFYRVTGDSRALKAIELLRFGTNDGVETLLLRYGFSAENIAEIVPFVQFIDENNIIFKDISSASEHVKELIDWYLP